MLAKQRWGKGTFEAEGSGSAKAPRWSSARTVLGTEGASWLMGHEKGVEQ